jgi:hypothetical protein
MKHEGRMQGISSRRPGWTRHTTHGTKKTTRRGEGNGHAMLYPKGSQNAGTQRIQASTHPAEIWWVARTQIMVVRLLQAITILRGSRATTMQSLQLHLTSAARSWLNTLPNDLGRCLHIWSSPFRSHWRTGKSKTQNGVKTNGNSKQICQWRRFLS